MQRRTGVTVLLVLFLTLAGIAAGGVPQSSTGVADTDLSPNQVYATADEDVDVWEAALLPLRLNRSTTATQVQSPDFRVICTVRGERSFGKPVAGIYANGTTLEMDFDDARAGSGALDNTSIEVVAVRTRGSTDTIPTTYNETVALLDDDAVNPATTYYSVGETTTDAQGTAEFSFTPPSPGHYTFYAVNPPGNVSVTDGDLSITGPVEMVGIEAATVQDGSATVRDVTADPAPADRILFQLDATDPVGQDGVTHVVAVYNESQLVDSTHTIVANASDLGPGFDSTTDTELRQSFDGTVGEARIVEDPSVGGVDLTDDVTARQANIQGLVDYVGRNVSTTNASDLADDDSVFYASVTAANDTDGRRALLVGTDEEWTPGEYRYVYVAQDADDGTVLASTTGTVNVSENPFRSAPGAQPEGVPPHDMNGDGNYDDVDGDGDRDFEDVIALAFADYGAVNDSPETRGAFDFDGNGVFDFRDVISLAFDL